MELGPRGVAKRFFFHRRDRNWRAGTRIARLNPDRRGCSGLLGPWTSPSALIEVQGRTLDKPALQAPPQRLMSISVGDTAVSARRCPPIGENKPGHTSHGSSASPAADHGERIKYVDAFEQTLTKLGNVASQFAR